MSDIIIRATGEKLPIRLVFSDFTELANLIGSQHKAKAWSLSLLADTMIASSFLSASLKYPGSVSFQAKYSGDISLVQADTNPLGMVRANISEEECATLGEFEPALSPQLITVKKFSDKGQVLSEGIVEMVSPKLGPSLATYLIHSEQVKSAVMIESKWNDQDPSKLDYAYGYFIETFPDINKYELAELEENLLDITSLAEFRTEEGFDVEALFKKIFRLNTWTIHREIVPKAFCPCSVDRIEKSLLSLGVQGLQEIIDDSQDIEMKCDYCKRKYNVTLSKLNELRESLL